MRGYLEKRFINSFIIFLLILSNSCQEKNEKSQSKEVPLNPNKILGKIEGNTSVTIKLPDSIRTNEEVVGGIYYHSEFDSIILGKEDIRSLNFYVTQSKNVSESFAVLRKSNLDTMVRVNDSLIFVHGFSFKEAGEYVLDGYIVDEILLDRDKDMDAAITTIETKIIHPIKVHQ